MEKPPKIGRLMQFSCKRSIAKELWDAKGNRAKGKSLEARAWDYKQYQRKNSKFVFGADQNRLLSSVG